MVRVQTHAQADEPALQVFPRGMVLAQRAVVREVEIPPACRAICAAGWPPLTHRRGPPDHHDGRAEPEPFMGGGDLGADLREATASPRAATNRCGRRSRSPVSHGAREVSAIGRRACPLRGQVHPGQRWPAPVRTVQGPVAVERHEVVAGPHSGLASCTPSSWLPDQSGLSGDTSTTSARSGGPGSRSAPLSPRLAIRRCRPSAGGLRGPRYQPRDGVGSPTGT